MSCQKSDWNQCHVLRQNLSAEKWCAPRLWRGAGDSCSESPRTIRLKWQAKTCSNNQRHNSDMLFDADGLLLWQLPRVRGWQRLCCGVPLACPLAASLADFDKKKLKGKQK
jgi:hypothetical protein